MIQRILCRCKEFIASYNTETKLFHVPSLKSGAWTCLLPVTFRCGTKQCRGPDSTYTLHEIAEETFDCKTCGKWLAYSLPGWPEVIKLSLYRITDVFISDLHMKCGKCGSGFRLRTLREDGSIDSDQPAPYKGELDGAQDST